MKRASNTAAVKTLGFSLLMVAVGCLPLAVAGETEWREDDFERLVAPILVTRCLECHNESTASGNLLLTHAESALRGGDSGAAIEPGNAEASFLIERVAAGEMPPESKGRSQRLPDEEILALRRWISAGAKWPADRSLDLYERTTASRAGRDWWSLQPVRRPDVPAVESSARARIRSTRLSLRI